ncbi:acetyl-CoA carboxylase biotin carboxyl carrier protein [candidate division WOR-3 bacterium]|jgi:acetyl-CoA carboxylase biotin carboxyl carrier protein|nr:acetyl-CoA carboxylase biotin carboxyl carrier protein [candidate division WOR-3 bacterium]
MKFKDIEKLVKILENSLVAEIEITDLLGRKIKISKLTNNTNPPSLSVTTAPVVQETKIEKEKPAESTENLVVIKSPIVGTFYISSAPDAPPYIKVGDIVKPGQVVCIVEAMKLMNEIESDVAGKIVKILAKNEDPIEYNQELFLVEPL